MRNKEVKTYRMSGKVAYALCDLILERESCRACGGQYILRLSLGHGTEVRGSGTSPGAALSDLRGRMGALATELENKGKGLKDA